jgi:hypothetical protein
MLPFLKHITTIVIQLTILLVSNVLLAQLILQPGSSITVKQGSILYVGCDLQLKSNSTASGHFADQTINTSVTITGDVLVERFLSSDGWHNTSSPVSNARSNVYTGTDMVFYYNETIILNDWEFGWVFYNGLLSLMKGYDIFLPTSDLTVIYTATGAESLNTGAYSIPVTRTNVPNGEIENHKGWNLVGNPYPSPLDWLVEDGWNKTAINDAKYIWNPAANNYTIFLGGREPVGINGGTQYIPSNQGFWVQAIQNGTLQVNNRARKSIMSATPDFYKNSDSETPLVCFQADGNGYSDQSIIRFISGSALNFDAGLDAVKLSSGSELVPQICTVAGKNFLAINTLPQLTDNLRIELNFTSGTPGFYSLGIAYTTNFDNGYEIYLSDRLTHDLVNLTNDPVYRFFHDPGNAKGRFYVYFNPSDDIKNKITPENSFSVFACRNLITIVKHSGKEVSGKFVLYDILGRCRYSRPLTNDSQIRFQVDVPAGYYVAHIESNLFTFSQKVRITE